MQYNITFNAKQLTVSGLVLPLHNKNSYLDDNSIRWVDQVRHLCNIMHSNLSDLPDCEIKCSTLTGSVNTLFGVL